MSASKDTILPRFFSIDLNNFKLETSNFLITYLEKSNDTALKIKLLFIILALSV